MDRLREVLGTPQSKGPSPDPEAERKEKLSDFLATVLGAKQPSEPKRKESEGSGDGDKPSV